jgi:hypothetical protein
MEESGALSPAPAIFALQAPVCSGSRGDWATGKRRRPGLRIARLHNGRGGECPLSHVLISWSLLVADRDVALVEPATPGATGRRDRIGSPLIDVAEHRQVQVDIAHVRAIPKNSAYHARLGRRRYAEKKPGARGNSDATSPPSGRLRGRARPESQPESALSACLGDTARFVSSHFVGTPRVTARGPKYLAGHRWRCQADVRIL